MRIPQIALGVILFFSPAAWAEVPTAQTTGDLQDYLGFQAGVNLSSVEPNTPGAEDHTGFEVGAGLEIPFDVWFSLMPEIRFVQKGFDLNQTPLGVPDHIHVPLDYLEFPVLAKFKVTSGSSVTPYFFLGPNLAWRLGGGSVVLNDGETLDTNLRKFDVSLDFGAGVDVLTASRLKTFLAIQYSLGFAGINVGSADDNRSVQILVGVALPI